LPILHPEFQITNFNVNMKKSIRSLARIPLLFLLVALFSQCNVRSVSINTLRPAAITFPPYVNTLLLVDRTKYEHRRDEIIHDIFSGGVPGEDRAALQAAMSSLNSTLQLSPRFKILMATEVLRGNSLTNAFPDPLRWDEVQRLCQEYNCEAIVSFEIFGSNFEVTTGDRKVKKSEKNDKGVMVEREEKEYYARGEGSVRMGIRLYDPKGMTIIDQQLFTQRNNWEGRGNNEREAYEHLIQKSDATRNVASKAASDYAYKIAPMPVQLSRQFYSKSKKVPQMEQGTKQTAVNDWNGAINTWQSALTNTTPPKQAGQLCVNIAVAYEVLGDLESAKKWASRAYVEYNNKNALNYKNMLDNREADKQRVDEQMK